MLIVLIPLFQIVVSSEAYLGSSLWRSVSAKIINDFKLLTIFAKNFIIDI